MENLSTPAAALPAPLPTQFQTLPLEIRHQIYESLIDLPCTIIVSRSVPNESTLVKEESRENLGPLSKPCWKWKDEIHSCAVKLSCRGIIVDESVSNTSTPIRGERRGNLGALSDSCKRLREEIHSWAPILEHRGILISKAFGVVDPKLTKFRFYWPDLEVLQVEPQAGLAPQALEHIIENFAMWKARIMEDESLATVKFLQRRLRKKGTHYTAWWDSWGWLLTERVSEISFWLCVPYWAFSENGRW